MVPHGHRMGMERRGNVETLNGTQQQGEGQEGSTVRLRRAAPIAVVPILNTHKKLAFPRVIRIQPPRLRAPFTKNSLWPSGSKNNYSGYHWTSVAIAVLCFVVFLPQHTVSEG